MLDHCTHTARPKGGNRGCSSILLPSSSSSGHKSEMEGENAHMADFQDFQSLGWLENSHFPLSQCKTWEVGKMHLYSGWHYKWFIRSTKSSLSCFPASRQHYICYLIFLMATVKKLADSSLFRSHEYLETEDTSKHLARVLAHSRHSNIQIKYMNFRRSFSNIAKDNWLFSPISMYTYLKI